MSFGGERMDRKSLNKSIRNAIKRGDHLTVEKLIEENPGALHTMTPFGTWLHVAAKKGHLDIVKYFLHKGIDVNAKGDIFDSGPLNGAAGAGHIEIVKYLVENGAELDVTLAKRNPLFGAIYGGHRDVVVFLVEEGMDISVRYTGEVLKNMNAYEYAREFGQTEIAEYLKSNMNLDEQ